jgi:hypothetical protein
MPHFLLLPSRLPYCKRSIPAVVKMLTVYFFTQTPSVRKFPGILGNFPIFLCLFYKFPGIFPKNGKFPELQTLQTPLFNLV